MKKAVSGQRLLIFGLFALASGSQGCLMSLPELGRVTEPINQQTPERRWLNNRDLARLRCAANFAGIVTQDIAAMRERRDTTNLWLSIGGALVAAVTAFIGAVQSSRETPPPAMLYVSGSTAAIATLSPLTRFISARLEPSFSAMNQQVSRIERYLDSIARTPSEQIVDIQVPPAIVQDAQQIEETISSSYGSRFIVDQMNRCVARVSGITTLL